MYLTVYYKYFFYRLGLVATQTKMAGHYKRFAGLPF